MINATPTTATAAVIAALSLLISSGLLGAVLVYFRRLVDARIGAIHTAQAIAITGEAVRAAEQIGHQHGLDGAQKYREAFDRSVAFFNDHGIGVTPAQLHTLIEGAVTQIKQANGAPLPGVLLTGDSPTINAAPLVPTGPTADQLIAAITTAVAAVYPPVGQAAPVEQPVAAAVVSVGVTPVALGGPPTAP